MLRTVLPRRLIHLRELFGVSVERLAREAGIHPKTLTRLEMGDAENPRVLTLLAIGDRFRVSPDYLLGYERDPDYARSMLSTANLLTAYRRIEAGAGRHCEICDRPLLVSEAHRPGRCLLNLAEQGNHPAVLAGRFGFTVASIEMILREEYEILRTRARV